MRPGRGWIPDAEGGKSHFSFSAENTVPPAGSISYAASGGGIKLKCGVSSVSVPDAQTASFGGFCTFEDGSTGRYEADVEDNAESGRGADRFTIRVFDSRGVQFHSAGGLLGAGNIQVETE